MPPKGYKKNPYPPIPDICHCVDHCGTIVYDGKQYVKGHDSKGRISKLKGIPLTSDKKKEFALKCTKLFLLKPDGSKEIYPPIFDLCWCGCNTIVYGGKRFVQNHNGRGKNNGMYGKKSWCKGLTKETNEIIAKNAIITSEFMRLHNPMKGKFGALHPLYGTHHSPETIQKLIDSHIGKSGELSSNWQGGLSLEDYPQEFNDDLKYTIRKRDNHVCQLCEKDQDQEIFEYERSLSIHHIDYNKKNNNTENLISLCIGCHMETNFERRFFEEYFIYNRNK